MGNVTALGMDVITEKSGHTVTPLAVSDAVTEALASPALRDAPGFVGRE